MKALYCDGGVIGRNPSAIGGTYAFRLLFGDQVTKEQGGVIVPAQAELPEITNNLTEMLAVVRGMQALPADWIGNIYSDSEITLGRIYLGWKWKNIPGWLHKEFQHERQRLVEWDWIGFVLLGGHPTRADLAAGIGKRGHPVSPHNVWCDQECGRQAEAYLARMAEQA